MARSFYSCMTALVTILLLCTCSKKSSTGPSSWYIIVRPSEVTLLEGRSTYLNVQTNISSNSLEMGSLWWHLEGRGFAAIEYMNNLHTAIRLTAFSPDTVLAIASYMEGPPADTALVVVLYVPVASVKLYPDSINIAVGEWINIIPVLQDSTGWPLVRAHLLWASSDSIVTSVKEVPGGGFSGNGIGQVLGKSPGQTTITAMVDGVSAIARVTVEDK